MQSFIKVLKSIVIILFINQFQFTLGQIEEAKCTEYKKSIFELTTTFSVFMHGAHEFNVTVDTCKQYAPFIVGGSPALPKEFPPAARLGHAEDGKSIISWFCGGTLISAKFVLTAAHCFFASQGDVNLVRLGELNFGSDQDDAEPEDYLVERIIEHPDYEENAIYNDIGLIELARAVNFSEYKHPACLPIANNVEDNRFVAIGWGATGYALSGSDKLLKVNLNRIIYDECNRLTSGNSDNLPNGLDQRTQLCAGDFTGSKPKDTCTGDSGGPLFAFHKDYPCLYYIVGVTSYGVGCGFQESPGIYTNVYSYMDWIKKFIWK